MHISLDGYVTGPDNDCSWITHGFDDELNAYIKTTIMPSVDHMLLGRKLAIGFIPHWIAHPELEGADVINSLRKTVVTCTLKESPWGEDVALIGRREKIEERVNDLKAQKGGDIITYGGARTGRALVAANLV